MFNYLSFANVPYMCCLPTGITNFGGDTQVFTIPDDIRNGQIGMYLNEPALGLLNCPNNTIWNNWAYTPMPYFGFGGYC